MAMVKEYFKYTKELENTYGKDKTIVLYQCGDFYEVYGLKNKNTGKIHGSNILDFSKTLDMEVSIKSNLEYNNTDLVLMSGFPVFKRDHHCNRLFDAGFTVAVYEQVKENDKINRCLSEIISPGTYLGKDTLNITNHFTCIWIEQTYSKKNGSYLHFGMASADIYTGETTLFENHVPYESNSSPYNELERFLMSCCPKQLIFIYDIHEEEMQKVIKYLSISCPIHFFNSKSPNINPKRKKQIKNSQKQTFQKEILKNYFNLEHLENNRVYEYAIQSCCFLLEFIYEHNPSIVTKMKQPVFQNSSNRVILENHSLKQLNIISNNDLISSNKNISSISKFLNKCKTFMGKRLLEKNILNPIKDIDALNEKYYFIDTILKMDKTNILSIDSIREQLSSVIDIEKLNRKIIKKQVTPSDMSILFKSLNVMTEIHDIYLRGLNELETAKSCKEHIEGLQYKKVIESVKDIIDSHIDIDAANLITTCDYNSHFIKKGLCHEHDELIRIYNKNYNELEVIVKYLNTELETVAKKYKNNDMIEIIYIKEETKVIVTSARFKKLKEVLDFLTAPSVILKYENDEEIVEFEISTKITANKAKKGYNYIVTKDISTLCSNIDTYREKISESTGRLFEQLLKSLQNLNAEIVLISDFIAELDLNYCKAYLSKKYNYVKPVINQTERSYVISCKLRHPLIENINNDELYVPNDIEFCDTQTGILLYGTNAVGKSSLIKSIGIAIIMAQAGFYVAASSFQYNPYHSIFTRILGNDNLFKGLSTFAVEILELNTILRCADSNSLVIGDEVCSGTEIESATSIIVATLQKLHDIQSSFIFATHFHDICRYDEIKALKQLKIKHLSVTFNAERDCLEYDRILKDGQGETFYGLTVAEAYKMPQDILLNANNIRTKYLVSSNVQRDNILNLKQSAYNSNKLLGDFCEMCKENISKDIHHLQHQKNADENGFIGTVHKNDSGNLIGICEDCHQKIHKNDVQHIKKKTTNGIIFKTI
tara:strand:- start:5884 stop:8874 length:2991 start_codon:yes stop_codon:yes gene_type:complete